MFPSVCSKKQYILIDSLLSKAVIVPLISTSAFSLENIDIQDTILALLLTNGPYQLTLEPPA